MSLVRFAIRDVVEQVDRAGQCAKNGERRHRRRDSRGLEQAASEHHARKYEQVLGPLFGPQGRKQQCRR